MLDNKTLNNNVVRLEHPKVFFDNRYFEVTVSIETSMVLYLAKKARDGDIDAISALDAINLNIVDADGNEYWPMSNDNEEKL